MEGDGLASAGGLADASGGTDAGGASVGAADGDWSDGSGLADGCSAWLLALGLALGLDGADGDAVVGMHAATSRAMTRNARDGRADMPAKGKPRR
jgi:hypothetical protein